MGSGGLAYKFGWPAIVYETAMLGGLSGPGDRGKRLHLFTDAWTSSPGPIRWNELDSKFIKVFISLLIMRLLFPVLMAQFKGAGVATAALLKVLTAGRFWSPDDHRVLQFHGRFRASAYSTFFQSIVMGVSVLIAVRPSSGPWGVFGHQRLSWLAEPA